MDKSKVLVVIPAREGSKGVPGKNRKILAGKPLIQYTIEAAKECFPIENICVTTDDPLIIKIAESCGLNVPFVRPKSLAEDQVGSYEVLLHAVDNYATQREFEYLLLLQPTSPFRTSKHIEESLSTYNDAMDLLMSVVESKANPYFNLMEENSEGFLTKSKISSAARRQDVPDVYEINGAIYLTKISQLKEHPFSEMKSIGKYVMSESASIDIDTKLDWEIAEFLMNKD